MYVGLKKSSFVMVMEAVLTPVDEGLNVTLKVIEEPDATVAG